MSIVFGLTKEIALIIFFHLFLSFSTKNVNFFKLRGRNIRHIVSMWSRAKKYIHINIIENQTSKLFVSDKIELNLFLSSFKIIFHVSLLGKFAFYWSLLSILFKSINSESLYLVPFFVHT